MMEAQARDTRLFTIDETAKLLKVSRKTVERMLKTGRLKGINLSPYGSTVRKSL